MPNRFTVHHREVGMLRIYLKPSDKIGPRRFWGAKPLYRELIRTAKGSVAKIVKLEHAWRRLDGRNDDGFQVAPFPG
jgi:hypothetical protein